MNVSKLGNFRLILLAPIYMALTWTCFAGAPFSGKVVERMESGGYVYLNMDSDGETRWVATQSTLADVGDVVDVSESMEMKDFLSKSMDRLFPVIYFASKVTSDGDPVSGSAPEGLPEGHPNISSMSDFSMSGNGAMGSSHHGSEIDETSVDAVIQSLTEREGCLTIEEIFSTKDSLNGKSVKVQAVVTKFSPNILDTNWIRMKDGTGETGADTLMVTSTHVAEPGSIVIVEGTINYDYDLGYGYMYPAIIKEASLDIIQPSE